MNEDHTVNEQSRPTMKRSRHQNRVQPFPRRRRSGASSVSVWYAAAAAAAAAFAACRPSQCRGSTPPHSMPEVWGSILRPSEARRCLDAAHGRLGSRGGMVRRVGLEREGWNRRSREGRAELIDPREGIVFDNDNDDVPPRSMVAPSGRGSRFDDVEGIGSREQLVPGELVDRRRSYSSQGGGDDDDNNDDEDAYLSIQPALPSFDVPDGCGSSLTSLLTRPPTMSARLSWANDVAPLDALSMSRLSDAGSDSFRRTRLPPIMATTTTTTTTLRKTGTTIAGVLCNGGRTVVIGADTRATDGTVVADKRCEKVHRLADNVWCCGAGTSGDIDALVRRVRYAFLLKGMISESVGNGPFVHEDEYDDDDDDESEDEYGKSGGDGDGDGDENENENEDRDSVGTGPSASSIEGEQGRIYLPPAPVPAVCRFIRDRLYDAGGSIGANLVLGGYDRRSGRAVLVAIHPHGSMDVVPYTALGSGGLAATAVLESWHHRFPGDGRQGGEGGGGGRGGSKGEGIAETLSVEDAMKLVRDAVGAGISNDMGSGSQVDLCVIGPDGVTYRRAVVPEEELPVTRGELEADAALGMLHAGEEDGAGDDVIMNGVNGFGSLPYFVQSRRVIMDGEEAVWRSRRARLEELLDLDSGYEESPDEL